MSDMKCPFCQQELNQDNPQSIECRNDDCKKSYFMYGSKELWQELIRTKELLEIEDAEHSMCHTQMLKTTEKLERTRKALDVAVDALKHYCTDSDNWSCVIDFTGDYNNTPSEFADKALEQITALEQKDHFANASKKVEQKDVK